MKQMCNEKMKGFDNLLISSPGNPGEGGLVCLVEGEPVVISSISTTGICVDNDQLYIGYQDDGGRFLLIYDGQKSRVQKLSDDRFDIHDVFKINGELYLAATESNEVVCIDEKGFRIKERWGLPGENDSAHLNSINYYQGRLIASLFGFFEKHREYKGRSRGAGKVIDVQTGETLIDGLSQPHSLTVADQNTLFLCNSEEMELHEYNGWDLRRKVKLDGYTRGICLAGDKIYVGLSISRNIEPSSFSIRKGSLVALDRETLEVVEMKEIPLKEIYDIRKMETLVPILRAIKADTDFSWQLKKDVELTRLRAELNCVKEELVRVYNSLSWKATAPLRWARYMLGGRMIRDRMGHRFLHLKRLK